MAKLFAGEDLDIEQTAPEQLIEAKIENSDIPDIVEFHEDAIQVAVEGVTRASNELYILRDIKASLESKKLSSVEYFTSIENYSLYMKSVANNLGVKVRIPSLEDFKNPYGVQTSHQIAMEGFMEFMRSIWEKIKSFFKDFFKRVMLFFKRLVNANLQMEEYEMYIEDMMHKVKRSDKNTAEQIRVDSKLPSLLAAPELDKMKTDYLLTKGKQKLGNLSTFIKSFTEVVKGRFAGEFKDKMDQLSKLLSDKSRVLTVDDVDSLRHDIADTFKVVFGTSLDFNSLPEDIQNDVMNIFDTEQLKGGSYFSAIPDRNPIQALPRDFNIYHVVCDYNVDATNRSTKLFISGNSQRNNVTESYLETIGSKDNLLRLYDFYKDFGKKVKIDRIEKMMSDFDKTIDTLTNGIRKPFEMAMENKDGFTDEEMEERRNLVSDPAAVDALLAGFANFDYAQSTANNNYHSGSNQDANRHSPEVRAKLEDLHKFIINMLNVIQVLLKEISVGLLGLYQECRYEMIKYLYKCAKQFA